MTINELYNLIIERKNVPLEGSYTTSLFNDGLDRVVQKVGEESVEVVIAAKNDDRDEFIGEVADLHYHLLVLLAAKGVTVEDIEQRLSERHEQKTSENKEK